MSVLDFIILFGGIAFFLFGMSLMGDGLKKIGGNKLETILYKLSENPIKGILLGLGVTSIIQSSSATSILVVGFVNSKMMKVKQAISVIMGAIIGTSITGFIICLASLKNSTSASNLSSIEIISAISAVVGIILKMGVKNKNIKKIGDIFLGFSVLMLGMELMSSSVSSLKNNSDFINMMVSFNNPLIGIIIGILFAMVLQSASAAVGILQALSTSGTITFSLALPLILGIAIGASSPVIISATGSTTDGKKTAFSYLVIEILRVVIFSIVFYLLDLIIHFSFMNDIMDMFSIAMLNLLFRIITVIVLLPFIDLIEKFLDYLIKPSKKEIDVSILDEKFFMYPQIAIKQSTIVINSMAEETKKGMLTAIDLLNNYSEKDFEIVVSSEEKVDLYEDQLGSYLAKFSGRDLTTEENTYTTMYLKVITDFERMSDHSLNIAESAQEIFEKKIKFSDKGMKSIKTLISAIKEIISLSIDSFIKNNIDTAYMVEPLEEVIDIICKEYKAEHIERVKQGICTISTGYIFNDILTDFERISDHCSNVALVVIESKKGTFNMHSSVSKIVKDNLNNFNNYFEKYKNKYIEENHGNGGF